MKESEEYLNIDKGEIPFTVQTMDAIAALTAMKQDAERELIEYSEFYSKMLNDPLTGKNYAWLHMSHAERVAQFRNHKG